jgi:hypothetical protein
MRLTLAILTSALLATAANAQSITPSSDLRTPVLAYPAGPAAQSLALPPLPVPSADTSLIVAAAPFGAPIEPQAAPQLPPAAIGADPLPPTRQIEAHGGTASRATAPATRKVERRARPQRERAEPARPLYRQAYRAERQTYSATRQLGRFWPPVF